MQTPRRPSSPCHHHHKTFINQHPPTPIHLHHAIVNPPSTSPSPPQPPSLLTYNNCREPPPSSSPSFPSLDGCGVSLQSKPPQGGVRCGLAATTAAPQGGVRCWACGILLLAWMGWDADIEGRGLGELCTYDKMLMSFKHMTENISYLTDYEKIDEGYVAFGGNPKVTRKCTIKTGWMKGCCGYYLEEVDDSVFRVFNSVEKDSEQYELMERIVECTQCRSLVLQIQWFFMMRIKPLCDDGRKEGCVRSSKMKPKRLKKALYGLHHGLLEIGNETFVTYAVNNGFQRGKIDKTLFIKRYKGDILLVQVYVDDIIFGSTKKKLCIAFEKLMLEKFQMSYMGELTFFLGLQVKRKKDGIFISQDKYVAKILNKFGFTEVKTASTLMETQKPLLKDKDGEKVDVHMYRSMIGSLMYLTSSRPDIMFAVYACARYQVNPKVSHLHAMKRIFRYLKGQLKLGLWYSKDSPFDLVAYTDSDYAGASLDRKSTIGGYQFLGCRLISWQCKKQTMVTNSTT
ncbi:uncharacterized mitochondrial protein-like protein [Tanacetum coccineum]|uniref:Uncharacterized mitochondrial protein-like protein n=1 Tax=Tanacetum coccineum TaxID=301880 RepID=A0ABQ4XC68_9ASTR